MAERYTRHMNDRREGRQLYTLPAYARIQPYILRRRSDAAPRIMARSSGEKRIAFRHCSVSPAESFTPLRFIVRVRPRRSNISMRCSLSDAKYSPFQRR